MKKFLLGILFGLLICMCGCSGDVSYTTKYITNCESTELREKPSNGAPVISNPECGEAVSFEKDVENGYAKVVYNGVNGYVLSAFLSDEKPKDKKSDEVNEKIPEKFVNKNEYDSREYLISNLDDAYIEEYVAGFVRPRYNLINENIHQYSHSSLGDANLWYDGDICVKKEFQEGSAGYDMSRQYYYDDDGKLMFAFIFKGTTEHRLYFENDKIVRYIGDSGNLVNNPKSEEALNFAEHAMSEAY